EPEPDVVRATPPDGDLLPASRRRPPPQEGVPAVPDPEPGVLLARHVVPALVEAGLLPDPEVTLVRGEAPVLRRPAPDTRPVVRVAEVAPPTRAGGDVHVHIAHVEVVHPAPRAPAPARTRASRGPVVDHDAYLAARRGERS
ncbi:hypothetical protein, partial [Cellulomonas sp. ICMP 17802]|uniref:hypothetical protein n=1 Tax=Cellulomonas sp. ICMP 17802 TaxID=3239199 RepID=UPI00351AD137